MTITTGSGEVKSRWIRLNGKMVTEKEYDAYMNREKALVKKKKADERKALAKARAKAKSEERKALAKVKAKAKKSKVKTSKPTVRVEIGPTDVGSLYSTPKPRTKAKVKAKTSTAKKRVARPKSQGVQTEGYYIVAKPVSGGVPRFFNMVSGRPVASLESATYGKTPAEANDIIMTGQGFFPQYRFTVKKRKVPAPKKRLA